MASQEPELKNSEWRRRWQRDGRAQDVLCCPEDVRKQRYCKHEDFRLCERCEVPICNTCWEHLRSSHNYRIPQALANDNYKGYGHEFMYRNQVRWIEAVIACPYFSVLVTYFIEGQKGHMMEETLGAQSRACGYRGNLFSFQLDWDDIAKHMNKRTTDQQMKDWPHSPETVCNWIRVVLKHADDKSVDLMKHIKELRVRAHVVLGMARLCIHRHFDFLEERLTAMEIKERVRNLEAEVKTRIDRVYSADEGYHTVEGQMPKDSKPR